MCYRLAAALTIAASITASTAAADTVLQTIKYSFLEGPLFGTMAEVEYSYPTLPPGQPIETYQPTPAAGATYLDAVSDSLTYSLLVFSGSLNILQPEPYLSFLFDPATNSTGLLNLEVWNTPYVGLYFEGAPDIQVYRCGEDVNCVFSAEIAPVPLPAGLPLLLGGLGLLTLSVRRRWA